MKSIIGWCEFKRRWCLSQFDEQKTHQDPLRAEKTTHLRSEAVDGIRRSLYAVLSAHFIIRSMMFDAAREVGREVDRLSFTGCFQIITLRLSECASHDLERVDWWYRCLLEELREETIPPRCNRINPRVIKRKTSRWNKKRACYRKITPLTNTFAELIVMKI